MSIPLAITDADERAADAIKKHWVVDDTFEDAKKRCFAALSERRQDVLFLSHGKYREVFRRRTLS